MANLIDRKVALDVIDRVGDDYIKDAENLNEGTKRQVCVWRLKQHLQEAPSAYSEFLNHAQALLDAEWDTEATSSWEYIEPEQVLQRTVIGGLALLLRYRCKNCGYLSFSETNYCPECGRRMEGNNG